MNLAQRTEYEGGMHYRTRRDFLQAGLGVVGGSVIIACSAQLPAPRSGARPYRVGYLTASTLDANATSLAAFRQGLTELGYLEERDVVLEVRAADGREERLHELAAQLVQLQVSVIVTA